MGQTLGNGGHLSMLQLCDTEGGLLHSLTTHAQQPTVPAAVEQLLEAYSNIFTQPTSLLPPREEHDKKNTPSAGCKSGEQEALQVCQA